MEAPPPPPSPPAEPSWLERLLGAAAANRALQGLLYEPPARAPAPSRPLPKRPSRRPRKGPKAHAPRVAVINFDPARLGDLLGPRGETLRALEDEHRVDVDRSVPGEATIFARTAQACSAARQHVLELVGEVKPGDRHVATVLEVRDYGAVVKVLRNREGLLHVSEFRGFPEAPETLTVGDEIEVVVVAVDAILGHVKLSRARANGEGRRPPRRGGGGDRRRRGSNRD